ncbi:TPA: transcriptional regulator [Escherichia coli]
MMEMSVMMRQSKVECLCFDTFSFCYQNSFIIKDGEIIALTKKEVDVLALLCHYAPFIVSYEELRNLAWQGTYSSLQSISQVIKKIRKKINDRKKSIIVTHSKVGYRLGGEGKKITITNKEINNMIRITTTNKRHNHKILLEYNTSNADSYGENGIN